MYVKTAADLRPSADGSAVHASLVAGSGIKTRKLRSRITTQTRASYPFLTLRPQSQRMPNHRKLFVIKQSKWCKFMPKMHRNTSGSRVCLKLLGELMHLPRPLAAIGAYF